MSLPTQKTPPRDSMSDLTILIYGPSKIGKSTLCSNADNALFIATEAGLNSLDVYQQPIASWQDMLNVCADIAKGDHQFKTIILDTVDNAYKMCSDYICKKNNIQHESDLGFGKGFTLVNNEFQRVLTKLSLMPYGFYLISHAQDKEMDTPNGKRIKTIPTLPAKAREIVLGMVDIILFCDMEMVVGPDGKATERRVMRTKPSALYEAGDRTKRLPDVIDLNFSAFVNAYKSASPARAVTSEQIRTPKADEVPQEWADAMATLALVTAPMASLTRKKLTEYWLDAGPTALPDLLAELATIDLSRPPEPTKKEARAALAEMAVEAQTPTAVSPATEAFVDGLEPLPEAAIDSYQYEALNALLTAYGVDRDTLRAYCAKAGHLLPGANGPSLSRLKVTEFVKLRSKLQDAKKAGKNPITNKDETWSERTVRIINATKTTAYAPVA